MMCALMFIISNHYGIKCLSNLLQLEQSLMFKVMSDIMQTGMKCEIHLLLQLVCAGKKMICALMLIIRNHDVIKCLSNLLQLETCNVMFLSDF